MEEIGGCEFTTRKILTSSDKIMYKDIEGVEIQIKHNGGLVCDTRKSVPKPKYVGGIITNRRYAIFNPFIKYPFELPGAMISIYRICYSNTEFNS